MRGGSLLLILVAVMLFMSGLASGSNTMLVSSIAASLLAAVALVARARQAVPAGGGSRHADDGRAWRAGDRAEVPRRDDGPAPTSRVRPPEQRTAGATLAEEGQPEPAGGADRRSAAEFLVGQQGEDDADFDEDPPDEPPAQEMSTDDAVRLAGVPDEVLVVDGRPRYHLPGCGHLLGRDSEPLPVAEAIELGFDPCGRCEPNNTLLSGR